MVSPPERHAVVRSALAELREVPVRFAARGTRDPFSRPRRGLMLRAAAMHLKRLEKALADLSQENLEELGEVLFRAYRNDKQVFTVGNGGSSSTASHIAADLAKNTIGPNMKRFRISSLNENAAIVTALANDLGYESVFVEQLVNLIRAGDVLSSFRLAGTRPTYSRPCGTRGDRAPRSLGF